MSFRTPPGRTHRFYTGTPQFAFGFGLSFSAFALAPAGGGLEDAHAPRTIAVGPSDSELRVPVTLRNTGPRAGSQVVLAWFQPASDVDRRRLGDRLGLAPPRQALVGYVRSDRLAPGEEQRLEVSLRVRDMMLSTATDARGGSVRRVLPTGQYALRLDLGAGGPAVVHRVDVGADVVA